MVVRRGCRDLYKRRGSVLRHCWGLGRGRVSGRTDRTWSFDWTRRVVRGGVRGGKAKEKVWEELRFFFSLGGQ